MSYTCPDCGMTSYHPKDEEKKFCANCNEFEDIKEMVMKQLIHHSNLIENIDSHEEDMQSLSAWNWLKDQKKLSHSVICELHKRITLNQLTGAFKGYYRDVTQSNVRVGDRVCLDYKCVPWYMENWLLDLGKKTPLENHIAFEKIHPFVDGNGRTGRMLMWWQQLKNKEKLTPFTIDKRAEYYKLFEEE